MLITVEGPRHTALRKGKGKRKSTGYSPFGEWCACVVELLLAVDTEELSRHDSFLPSAATGFEGNQAKVEDEFIRSSLYPPPAGQRFAAYCVFNS